MLVIQLEFGLPIGDETRVLHRARREIGQADHVEFLEGILDAEVLVEVLHAPFRDFERVAIVLLGAGRPPHANLNPVCLAFHRLEMPDCQRNQVGRHLRRGRECHGVLRLARPRCV